MWTYSQPLLPRRWPSLSVSVRVVRRRRSPNARLPAPPSIRPSFLTSMCTSSPGRERSYRSGCSSPSRPSRPSPSRVRIPDTVDNGIASVSAISAAVIRSRRSFTITSTRSAAVRFATRRGADERSSKRRSPARYRPIHLRAQRTLTPAASAAAVTVHPSRTTRRASCRLPVQLRAALACRSIRVASLGLLPWTALSLQGGPDEPTPSGTTTSAHAGIRMGPSGVLTRRGRLPIDPRRSNHEDALFASRRRGVLGIRPRRRRACAGTLRNDGTHAQEQRPVLPGLLRRTQGHVPWHRYVEPHRGQDGAQQLLGQAPRDAQDDRGDLPLQRQAYGRAAAGLHLRARREDVHA